jgi:hypothetical protein
MSGINEVKVERGIAFFDNMILIAKPGSKSSMEVSVKYLHLTSNLFMDKCNFFFCLNNFIALRINFEMSFCDNGEII